MHKLINIVSWLMLSLALSLCCASCGSKSEGCSDIHEKSRDNIVEAQPTSIEDSLPMFHVYANIYLVGDTLIIEDYKSTDKMFYAYDLVRNKGLGWFGKVGQGPGELTNFGSVYINPNKKQLAGFDLGTMDVKAFQIDSALTDSETLAQTIVKYDGAANGFLLSPHFVNDTSVLARAYVYDFDTYTGSNRIVRFNPVTGHYTAIGEANPLLEKSFSIAYSPEVKRVYLAGKGRDFIQLYDPEGNLIKTVYGPKFEEENPSDHIEYFGTCITDSSGRLYVTYNGRDMMDGRAKDLLIYDKDGHYLKTIHFDVSHLWDLAYHEPSNRLYFSCDGEPQFGYINLSDYLDD